MYEREGLPPKPPRTASGYRIFSADAVQRLRFITSAQDLGLSLKEIRDLLGLRVKQSVRCADIRSRAELKIADVEQKIRSLQAIRKALVKITSTCGGKGPLSECPILEALDHEVNHS